MDDINNKSEHEYTYYDRTLLLDKQISRDIILTKIADIFTTNSLLCKTDLNINNNVFVDVSYDDIYNKLSNTTTLIGKHFFKLLLYNPISSIPILQQRQQCIKQCNNIKQELSLYLNNIRRIEDALFWFEDDTIKHHLHIISDLVYFNFDFYPLNTLNDILNNNINVLQYSSLYTILIAPLIAMVGPILAIVIPIIITLYFMRNNGIDVSFCNALKFIFKEVFNHDIIKSCIAGGKLNSALTSIMAQLISLFIYFQSIYYSYKQSNVTNKLVNILYLKLQSVQSFLYNVSNINVLLQQNNINLSSFITYDDIQNDLNILNNNCLFNNPIYLNELSLFSNRGIILYGLKQLNKYTSHLYNLFNYVGLIDSLVLINNLSTTFLSATYVFSKQPIINCTDIWHPLLMSSSYMNNVQFNTQNDIKNDRRTQNNGQFLEYYDDKGVMRQKFEAEGCNDTIIKNSVNIKNHLLITGPNAAGKTTFIKTLIINVLFSQTITITSATLFNITPFNIIDSYLQINDIVGKKSLFEAEMFRSKDIISKIEQPDALSFIILDEIFSSTNYIEGYAGAYAILKRLSENKQCISITTTHYTSLSKLEKDTSGLIKNYKFDVVIDEDNIIFNYKLKRGISTQYIALNLLKLNGFDNDIISNALDIVNKSKNNSSNVNYNKTT